MQKEMIQIQESPISKKIFGRDPYYYDFGTGKKIKREKESEKAIVYSAPKKETESKRGNESSYFGVDLLPESPVFDVKEEPLFSIGKKASSEKTSVYDMKRESEEDDFLKGFNSDIEERDMRVRTSYADKVKKEKDGPNTAGNFKSRVLDDWSSLDDFQKGFEYEALNDKEKAYVNAEEEKAKRKKEKVLDAISTGLTAASFIPGADTITNILQIPVDLMRGDFVGAGLDLVGAIPFVGEIADGVKTARTVDRIADTAKTVKKVEDTIDVAKVTTNKIVQKNITENSFKLPEVPDSLDDLIKNGWKDITPKDMIYNTRSKTFSKGEWTIRVDKAQKNANGYRGKDHYHILNPNSTGKLDYYLDKNGKPVAKNSKASHIIPERRKFDDDL